VSSPDELRDRWLCPRSAVAAVQFPPRLSTLGMFEMDLDPADVLPPSRSDRPDTGPVVR
jgi:hypothetical protein